MEENKSNIFVKGALLLTLAGFVSKVLSAGYRIPLQNLAGDLGFYVYQQVYPILGFALVLSLYGFPSAISKMVAESTSEGTEATFKHFYIPVWLILLGINGAIFSFLFLNAHSIAAWMEDIHMKNALQLASFAFLLIPFSALLRGAFQGNLKMKPTAISQMSEQFIRVFIIIFSAILIVKHKENIYGIGQTAAIASIIGSAIAIIVLIIFFMKEKPWGSSTYSIPWGYYCKTLLLLGIVAALNHMVLLIIQFADAFTLVPSLQEFGLSLPEAKEAKGVFDRGQPLIQFGTVIGSSFALAFIPTISKQSLHKDPAAFYEYIRSALMLSLSLALGATIGLIIIFPEANVLLFENDNGTASLRVLVVAIFLCSIAITASSILQGLGYIKRTAAFISASFVVKWIANQLFVPFWGVMGSAFATILSLIVLCFLVVIGLRRKLPGLRFLEQVNWRALAIACAGMTVYVWFIQAILALFDQPSRLVLLIYVLFMAITGAIIYIFLLVRLHFFTEKQLAMLPYSDLFIRIHRGRKNNG